MNVGRQVGVRIPENQSTEQAPVMTVTNFTPVQLGLVEYGDERGIKHTTLAFIVGQKAFLPPQGEQWTAGFKAFAQKISEQIVDKNELARGQGSVSVSKPVVPTADEVDVMGGSISDEQLGAAEDMLRKG